MNKSRILMLLFAILLAATLISSISITPLSISDTDASTYIIVPMLMIPLFALFMMKEEILPSPNKNSIIFGVVIFAVLLILEIHLMTSLSFLFLSYRLDMLLFPLLIIAIASVLFGISNLRKFSLIALYALFASPLLLLPIINLNSGFATLNSLLVYHISKLFFPSLYYSAPITLVLNGASVSIGQACVGIGALIGIIMLLIPIAYLYDGPTKKKVLWVFSGFFLLLALNFLRMLGIALLWFFYGPNQSVIELHAVIGQILFYGAVVVMVLLSAKYGLEYPLAKKVKAQKKKYSIMIPSLIAVIIALVYIFISLPFLNMQSVSTLQISYSNQEKLSWTSLISLVDSNANIQNYSSQSLLGQTNQSGEVDLYNISKNDTGLTIVFGPQNSTLENGLNGPFLYVMDSNGNVGKVYELSYNGTQLFVYSRKVPYLYGSIYVTMDMFAVLSTYPSWENSSCGSGFEQFYDVIINTLYLNFPSSTQASHINSAYCLISKVIK